MKDYYINEDIFRKAIMRFTASIMVHQKGWKKEDAFIDLEYKIDKAVKAVLKDTGIEII